ncbi:hypothetical protein ACVW00_003559 [Marmoricola sp. URHA0025 HA25]
MNPTEQIALERAITAELRGTGAYLAEMDQLGAQGVVDIQWAAYRAARALGVTATVRVRQTRSKGQSTKTVLLVNAQSRLAPAPLPD